MALCCIYVTNLVCVCWAAIYVLKRTGLALHLLDCIEIQTLALEKTYQFLAQAQLTGDFSLADWQSQEACLG